MGTAKVSTDPFGQLVSRKQPIGLDHIAFSVVRFESDPSNFERNLCYSEVERQKMLHRGDSS